MRLYPLTYERKCYAQARATPKRSYADAARHTRNGPVIFFGRELLNALVRCGGFVDPLAAMAALNNAPRKKKVYGTSNFEPLKLMKY